MSDCPEGKIFNPETKRCVNIDGKIGKLIQAGKSTKQPPRPVKEHIDDLHIGPCPADKIINPRTGLCIDACPEGTVINPQTGRCVKITGKIGKSLVGGAPAVRAASAYNLFVKDVLPKLKVQHPQSTPQERMAMAGAMWRESKPAVV